MTSSRALLVALSLAAALAYSACDTVVPVEDSRLVVEGFLDTGRPLPDVRIGHTLDPTDRYDRNAAAVDDAELELTLDGTAVGYHHQDGGVYRPEQAEPLRSEAGAPFTFRAAWRGEVVEVRGTVPPRIHIEYIDISVSDEPVSAVLLDSLALSDTLATGAYTGFIYPIEITVEWDPATPDRWDVDESWIRAQLKPISIFSSPVVDLFLRSDVILPEREVSLSGGRRKWTGVYAVGVAKPDDPLPVHRLRVSLVRSGADYARFAASKGTPERREPISNVDGGVGIFAAVSIDSISVDVGPSGIVSRAVSGGPEPRPIP